MRVRNLLIHGQIFQSSKASIASRAPNELSWMPASGVAIKKSFSEIWRFIAILEALLVEAEQTIGPKAAKWKPIKKRKNYITWKI